MDDTNDVTYRMVNYKQLSKDEAVEQFEAAVCTGVCPSFAALAALAECGDVMPEHVATAAIYDLGCGLDPEQLPPVTYRQVVPLLRELKLFLE